MVGSSSLKRIVRPCWKPSEGFNGGAGKLDSGAGTGVLSGGGGRARADGLLWYKDHGRHLVGEFSMAVVQANNELEDSSQIESGQLSFVSGDDGPQGTFVGVYDGHGGPEASRFVVENLFWNLKKYASEEQEISSNVIRKAYLATEEGFINTVRQNWHEKPQLASVGTCCLSGVICGGVLYVANAGDSRAVVGRYERDIRDVCPMQVCDEHNAVHKTVRDDLQAEHPDDPGIVVLKHNVWRVKGLIQISRSIGDAYLKNAEFNCAPLLPKFRLPEPFSKPILSPVPSIVEHTLSPEDQFVIFASDGLWEQLSSQEAVDMVHHSNRNGIAKRLIKAAMHQAAKKREMRYTDLKKIERGIRRHFHDDITVIVVFLDPLQISKKSFTGPTLSLKGAGLHTHSDSH